MRPSETITNFLAITASYWVPAAIGYSVTTSKIAQPLLVTLAATSKTAVAIAGELAKTAYSKIAIFLDAGMTNTKALMQILLSEGVPREIVLEFIEAAVETYLDEGTVEDFLLYGLVGAGIEIIAGSEVTQKVIKDGVEELLDSVNDIVLSPEARELKRNARKNAKEATEEHIERTVKTKAKDIAQNGAGSKAKGVEGAVDDTWDMARGGKIINGRRYSEHSLERMAPDTPAVRAELNTRAIKRAQAIGLKAGTKEYSIFIDKQINPRFVPPSVIEDAILNVPSTPGNTAGTFVHQTQDIKVIVNSSGDVITIIPK